MLLGVTPGLRLDGWDRSSFLTLAQALLSHPTSLFLVRELYTSLPTWKKLQRSNFYPSLPPSACAPTGATPTPTLTFAVATFIVDGSQGASLVELHGRRGPHGEAGRDGQARGGQARGDVAGGEELVRLQLGDGGPLGRVGVQHSLDERGRRRVDVLREGATTSSGSPRGPTSERASQSQRPRRITQGMV